MKVLTITLYMLGAILILPQQVCSMHTEQAFGETNTPPTNPIHYEELLTAQDPNTAFTSSHQTTSELPNTPANIITRLGNALGNYSNIELNAKLRKLVPNHLQTIERAFNVLTEGMTDQCRQRGLLDLLADIQHERLNNEFISAATELTSQVNALDILDINDTQDVKWIIVKALGNVDPLHLSLVMHANRTFIRRLGLDQDRTIDNIAEIAYLVRAIAEAENADEDAKKVGALLNFFTDERIASIRRCGWVTSSIICSFPMNEEAWKPFFGFLETGFRHLEYTTGNTGKNKSLSNIIDGNIERTLNIEDTEDSTRRARKEKTCSQCSTS